MKKIIIIFVSSFIWQLIAMHLFLGQNGPGLYEYEEIANNLLTKHAFLSHRLGSAYYSITAPLYPMLCAGVYLVSNYNHLAMLLVQITLISLVCVVVYLIGGHIFNKKVGVIGAVLCIFHPGLIIYSTVKLHDLSLVAFMFSLLALAILKFEKNLTYRRSFLIGILIGICILTRSSIVFFIPLFLIWLCGKDIFKARKSCWARAFIIVFMAAITVLPWVARNYHIHHKFVFIQMPSVDLWVGNNINATGSNYLKDGRTVLESMPTDFINNVYKADELTKERIFRSEVYKFILNNPYKFVALFFKKIYYFWWFSPQSGIEYPESYLLIYKIMYSIALLFAVFGIFFALSSGNEAVRRNSILLLLFFISISVSQSLFYVEGRHRWSIEPLLLIFSANGLVNINYRLRQCLKAKI